MPTYHIEFEPRHYGSDVVALDATDDATAIAEALKIARARLGAVICHGGDTFVEDDYDATLPAYLGIWLSAEHAAAGELPDAELIRTADDPADANLAPDDPAWDIERPDGTTPVDDYLGAVDMDEQDRRAYREELNERPRPSEY